MRKRLVADAAIRVTEGVTEEVVEAAVLGLTISLEIEKEVERRRRRQGREPVVFLDRQQFVDGSPFRAGLELKSGLLANTLEGRRASAAWGAREWKRNLGERRKRRDAPAG